MLVLILLRHGRTQANAQGLFQGRIDPNLDGLGERQAVAAAEWIGPVDRVISSPLGRARQTAAAFGVPVDVDERFIELDYGDWEGTKVSDIEATTWAQWRADLDYRPPNGETLRELGTRVRLGLNELEEQAREKRIVVVSHVSPIKAAVVWALGVGDEVAWNMRLGHASICQLELGPTGRQVVGLNQTAHTAGLETGTG